MSGDKSWWSVTRYLNWPSEIKVDRETEHYIWISASKGYRGAKAQKARKFSHYEQYYPSLEDAIKAILDRKVGRIESSKNQIQHGKESLIKAEKDVLIFRERCKQENIEI